MRFTNKNNGKYELNSGISHAEAVQQLGRYEDLGSLAYILEQREAVRQQDKIIKEYVRLFGCIRMKKENGRIIAWKKRS